MRGGLELACATFYSRTPLSFIPWLNYLKEKQPDHQPPLMVMFLLALALALYHRQTALASTTQMRISLPPRAGKGSL